MAVHQAVSRRSRKFDFVLTLGLAALFAAAAHPGLAADFDITDFGASPGGGSDLNAIRSAINAASAGDRVVIPAGTFQIDGTIAPKAGISIVGAGRDLSTLEYVGGNRAAMIDLSGGRNGVELTGFTLDGRNAGVARHGILGGNSSGHHLHNLGFRDFALSNDWSVQGIYFYANVDNTRIENNDFTNIGTNAEFGSAIRLSNGSQFNTIAGNTIQNMGRGGIHTERDSTDNVIRGNTVLGSGLAVGNGSLPLGIEIWMNSGRTIIEDNVIDHWLSVDRSDVVAVRRNTVLADEGLVAYAGIELAGGSDNVFTDNTVGRGHQIGLAIATFNEGSNKERVFIGRNTFSDSETWGAQLQDSAHPVGQVYLYDNTFERAENDGDELFGSTTAAMRLLSLGGGAGIENIVFESNRFIDNDETAIQLINQSQLDSLEFIDNTISGNGGAAVTGGNPANVVWQGNTVSGNGQNNTLSEGGFANGPPSVQITMDSLTVLVGETIDFGFLYTDDNSASPGDVLWDFDEGLPVLDASPSRSFDVAGVYDITLLAWDPQGRASRSSVTLNVLDYLPGDYDGNGQVDNADYVVWTQQFGQTVNGDALPNADGNGDGVVDAADYAFWRDHAVELSGSQSAMDQEPDSTTVPEPLTTVLLVGGILLSPLRWPRD
ncbi:MAG: right-handed parallel beta-helix repeat-containing protein [Planctomycetota bacterium]